ncbi:MAG TPA: UDP-glucose/GDP-mannose dehydrogenase family protein, partial [Candidatus Bathyarchaeia archaeon]|nr:UDP-glucose/GDP-mannose dehydrogenase family protein [Candidatus Bathyarchaeia archaeon]
MNLAVVGAGFVGLVTAAVFADFGNDVWVVEVDQEKIKKLKKGKAPFYEPNLERLIAKNTKTGRLKFTSCYQEAVPGAEVIFVCVGTPNKNGEIELGFLYSATKSIAKNLKKPAILAIKSTIPPGINGKIDKWMRRFTKIKFSLVSLPEFLAEGRAIEDTLHPYRVVIGTKDRKAAKKLLQLHQEISGERLICDPSSAQLIKFAANTFLPTKISFANALAVLCDKFGADVKKVMEGLGMDKRIGPDFLGAGIGYGGSCFPKDVDALINLAQKAGYDFDLIKATQKINQSQIDYFLKKAVRLCGGSVKGKKVVVLGLSFKPETSDLREARSIYVIKGLKKRGAKVIVCDPVAVPEAKRILKGVRFSADPYQALKGADALLLITEWKQYQNLDFDKIKKLMRHPVVVDGRNIYNRKRLEKLGFTYEGIGQ